MSKTGYRVPGFSAEDISEDHHIYEPVTCPACRQVHHVNRVEAAQTGLRDLDSLCATAIKGLRVP